METNYADLEIRLRGKLSSQEGNGYPVELTSYSSGQEFLGFFTSADDLPQLDLAKPGDTGLELFKWLFADPGLSSAWSLLRGQHPLRRIRLRIDDDAPELNVVPWELLREPVDQGAPIDLTAADATPFSRYPAGAWLPGIPVEERSVSILIAVANPTDLRAKGWPELKAGQELAGLEALKTSHPGRIDITTLEGPCSLLALTNALARGGYDVLHFIGHGSSEQIKDKNGHWKTEARLCLADDKTNLLEIVSDTRIAEALSRHLREPTIPPEDRLRLIYLSSCETAVRDPFDAFLGLAPQLVQSGVPAVIAMQEAVPADTAVKFSHDFYDALLRHGQIDRATNAARAARLTSADPAARIPVLFQRLRDGQLFGKPQIVLGDVTATTWDSLIRRVNTGECTPVLGPGVVAGLLPTGRDLAHALAAEGYPFDDKDDLRRVTQFIGRTDNSGMRTSVLTHLRKTLERNLRLAGVEAELDKLSSLTLEHWNALSQTFQTQIHNQLAELDLPLYVTTCFDNFMKLALERRLAERKARLDATGNTAEAAKLGAGHREAVRWKKDNAHRLQQNFEPKSSDPVVLHLFGTDEDKSNMVLTEDDHLDYLATCSREQEDFLPNSINALLTENTLLFLGYHLEDLDLKVILRGLLKNLAESDRMNLAVQVEGAMPDKEKQNQVVEYLQDSLKPYFSQSSTVRVFWGNSQDFVRQLLQERAVRSHGKR